MSPSRRREEDIIAFEDRLKEILQETEKRERFERKVIIGLSVLFLCVLFPVCINCTDEGGTMVIDFIDNKFFCFLVTILMLMTIFRVQEKFDTKKVWVEQMRKTLVNYAMDVDDDGSLHLESILETFTDSSEENSTLASSDEDECIPEFDFHNKRCPFYKPYEYEYSYEE